MCKKQPTTNGNKPPITLTTLKSALKTFILYQRNTILINCGKYRPEILTDYLRQCAVLNILIELPEVQSLTVTEFFNHKITSIKKYNGTNVLFHFMNDTGIAFFTFPVGTGFAAHITSEAINYVGTYTEENEDTENKEILACPMLAAMTSLNFSDLANRFPNVIKLFDYRIFMDKTPVFISFLHDSYYLKLPTNRTQIDILPNYYYRNRADVLTKSVLKCRGFITDMLSKKEGVDVLLRYPTLLRNMNEVCEDDEIAIKLYQKLELTIFTIPKFVIYLPDKLQEVFRMRLYHLQLQNLSQHPAWEAACRSLFCNANELKLEWVQRFGDKLLVYPPKPDTIWTVKDKKATSEPLPLMVSKAVYNTFIKTFQEKLTADDHASVSIVKKDGTSEIDYLLVQPNKPTINTFKNAHKTLFHLIQEDNKKLNPPVAKTKKKKPVIAPILDEDVTEEPTSLMVIPETTQMPKRKKKKKTRVRIKSSSPTAKKIASPVTKEAELAPIETPPIVEETAPESVILEPRLLPTEYLESWTQSINQAFCHVNGLCIEPSGQSEDQWPLLQVTIPATGIWSIKRNPMQQTANDKNITDAERTKLINDFIHYIHQEHLGKVTQHANTLIIEVMNSKIASLKNRQERNYSLFFKPNLQEKILDFKTLKPAATVSLLPAQEKWFATFNEIPGDYYLVGGAVLKLLKLKKGGVEKEKLSNNEKSDFDYIGTTRNYDLLFGNNFRSSKHFRSATNDPNLFTYVKGEVSVDYKYIGNHKSALNDDLALRDFTISALYCNTKGEILDPTRRGLRDLKNKVLDTINDPVKCFYDDPTRLLRAVKLISQGYTPSARVKKAMQEFDVANYINANAAIKNGVENPKAWSQVLTRIRENYDKHLKLNANRPEALKLYHKALADYDLQRKIISAPIQPSTKIAFTK